MEKYFQIARCFRDEDLRAERQLEFTQVDVEASFITDVEIQTLIEGLLARIFRESKGVENPTPFPRMPFQEAMDRFGSDKPDTRFGLEIVELSDIFAETQFKVFHSILASGGVIRALNAKGSAEKLSKEQLKKWEEWAKTELGAKGLAYIKVNAAGEWESPIVKFFSEAEKAALAERLDIAPGDVVFFGADQWHAACETLARAPALRGAARTREGQRRAELPLGRRFPLLMFVPEDNKWVAVHHPFTRPKTEDIPLLEAGEFAKVRAVPTTSCSTAWNSGGGSIRIHEKELQAKMFETLASAPRSSRKNLDTCSARFPSAPRRTAASRSASTAS